MSSWVILKVGGSLQGAHADVVVAAIQRSLRQGRQVIVVHGGGPRISQRLHEQGIEQPFVDGQRLTTPEAMHVVEQVLVHEVNPQLVEALRGQGVSACGIAGSDGILYAEPWPGLERTGRVRTVQAEKLYEATKRGEVPVLAPVAVDDKGRRYNVNADSAAAAVAARIGAERILFFTDVAGIFRDFTAGDRLVDTTVPELRQLTEQGCFQSGMIPKVRAICDALTAGVSSGFVLQGNARDAAEAAVIYPANVAWNSEYGTRVRAS
ncbi:acetylglutamate kinase [Alicyclobacillus herbarius]|uniref:acetylglutamate kinase n=1 Tax=Alicyclobacillus herbarius TaxID=122960 RepID=UPI000413AFA4|nr:acetylglutamate kinase [Alicyclobacillus herbarius]